MAPSVRLRGGGTPSVPVAYEQVDALDADVLALYDGGDAASRSALESSPQWPGLSVVTRDAVAALHDVDDDHFFALCQPTALSIPRAIESVAAGLIAAAER